MSTSSVNLFQPLRNVGQGDCKRLKSREGVLEVERVGVAVDSTELHHLDDMDNQLAISNKQFGMINHNVFRVKCSRYLFALMFDLEVLGRFLRDTTAEVQLVHLRDLINAKSSSH